MPLQLTFNGELCDVDGDLKIVDGAIDGNLAIRQIIEEDPFDDRPEDRPPEVDPVEEDDDKINPPTLKEEGTQQTYFMPREANKFNWQARKGDYEIGAFWGRKQALKVSVDFTKAPLSIAGGRYRTEFINGHIDGGLQYGEVYEDHWFLYIPSSNEPGPTHIIWQIHGRPDKHLGESYRNPTLGIYSNGLGNLRFYCNYDPKESKVNKGKPPSKTYANANVPRDQWIELAVRWKMSYKMDEGWACGFINGRHVGTYMGATTWNDDKSGYYKKGIYGFGVLPGKELRWGSGPVPDSISYGIDTSHIMRLPSNTQPV